MKEIKNRDFVWGLFFLNNYDNWELLEVSVNKEKIENMKADNSKMFDDPERYRVEQVRVLGAKKDD